MKLLPLLNNTNHWVTRPLILLLIIILPTLRTIGAPSAGFFLPDSLFEYTMKYRSIDNLVILPVTINGTIKVNLILDTGCRNLLLFGKSFKTLFKTEEKDVQFSGLGQGTPVTGRLSLGNDVEIGAVTGKKIPIIIVPRKNLFASLPNVDGIVGYEIFSKFEIELNFPHKLITFRSSRCFTSDNSFTYIPMQVIDSKPVLSCNVTTSDDDVTVDNLFIDTGSTLGLMVSKADLLSAKTPSTVGRGLNGVIMGETHRLETFKLNNLEFKDVSACYLFKESQQSSIGMDVLKGHVVIINYPKSYVAFQHTSNG